MIKHLLSIVFIFLFANSVIGQNDIDPFQTLVNNGLISTTFINPNTKIEGSPYVIDEFTPAQISILGNKIYPVKYNAFHDEIAVLTEDKSVYSLRKNSKNKIIVTYINPKKVYQIFKYFDDTNNEGSGFFIELTSKNVNVKLLKKERIIFIGDKKSISSYAESEPAKYKRIKDKYFIKINSESAISLPKNKKEIAKLFPENQKVVLDFIRDETIKFKKEEDLIRLIIFLNQLS